MKGLENLSLWQRLNSFPALCKRGLKLCNIYIHIYIVQYLKIQKYMVYKTKDKITLEQVKPLVN